MTSMMGFNSPHFVQPLNLDFLHNFGIPKKFQQHVKDGSEAYYLGGDDKIAKLRDNKGGIWFVKVDKATFIFKDGWKKFCQEHNLQVGDFVVFKLVGKLDFDVFMFDPSMCERQFSTPFNPTSNPPSHLIASSSNHHHHLPTNINANSYHTKDVNKESTKLETRNMSEHRTRYSMVLKPYHYNSSVLYIPVEFARSNGLKKSQEVELTNEKGHRRLMPFRINNEEGKKFAYIGRWKEFIIANGFEAGDTVILEFFKPENQHALIKLIHRPLIEMSQDRRPVLEHEMNE